MDDTLKVLLDEYAALKGQNEYLKRELAKAQYDAEHWRSTYAALWDLLLRNGETVLPEDIGSHSSAQEGGDV